MGFSYITVTRQRGTPGTPPYNEVDWSNPDEDEIEQCLLDPGGSTVIDDVSRLPVVTTPTLYAPFGADIVKLDRVVARGTTYSVVGKPAQWGECEDDLGGLVVKLEEVAG